ncbi:MAG TPA: class Ib ribonucleoside-diphosphate reductase assembly flavoprotein NrdI [Candidatus Limosilactobacillus merdipullorum]|uniref:Class Ib ribonucleoside-diphosphate reductase assembly flavoprotein NrdI n=1 Tax=Candidatus Limosilactobacillus merdipullorum TaxID=2838653 RepID=A0A9D1U513_9LACO|nr:class Ib ribonucleoside-diphosphate reductase assembly flavoprotein NrdI [Candidatus Limosilactobacillus merdipullorum]
MSKIYVLFISIEGNTRSFLTRMQAFAKQQHSINPKNPVIELKEITDQTVPEKEEQPFFAFVPTYLDGGDGINSGFKELMTNPLGEYIANNNNAEKCMGVVGSGNKNFNQQYCLTAQMYARNFNAPFLADYELRGTSEDIERIYGILSKEVNKDEQ